MDAYREHEFTNGFGYEPDDRSVGIYGGFHHINVDGEPCVSDPVELASNEHMVGEGANRQRVTELTLHCSDCNVRSEPFAWTEWDPEVPDDWDPDA